MKIRVIRARSRRQKESRTIRVWGSPERGDGLDHNKWYYCWNCGFMNHEDRSALGGSESLDGVIHTDYVNYPDRGEVRLGEALVAMENDSGGNPKSVRYNVKVGPNNGCSFCGTLNWRGDY